MKKNNIISPCLHGETEVTHLHLDVKDASFLLNLLLDSSHGLVKDRQALCALQSGRCHHVARWSDQVDLPRRSLINAPSGIYTNSS